MFIPICLSPTNEFVTIHRHLSLLWALSHVHLISDAKLNSHHRLPSSIWPNYSTYEGVNLILQLILLGWVRVKVHILKFVDHIMSRTIEWPNNILFHAQDVQFSAWWSIGDLTSIRDMKKFIIYKWVQTLSYKPILQDLARLKIHF